MALPFFEWFIRTSTQPDRVVSSNPFREATFQSQIHEAMISEKCCFTSSAIAMLKALAPENLLDLITQQNKPTILSGPSHPIWIEFSEPPVIQIGNMLQNTQIGFFLMHRLYDENIEPDQRDGRLDGTWGLTLFTASMQFLNLYFYNPALGFWDTAPDQCLTGQCDSVMDSTGNFVISLCPVCAYYFGISRFLFTTALLMIQGYFAVSPDENPWEIQKGSYTIRTSRSKNSKKHRRIPHEYEFKLITFDACLKKKTSVSTNESEKRGSWTEIDPDSVVWVSKYIRIGKRILDPAKNSYWKKYQEVAVKAHYKLIPVRVYIGKRVIASQYEYPIVKNSLPISQMIDVK